MSDITATTTTTTISYTPLDLAFSIDKITSDAKINSNNVVVGKGAFDKLMETATVHLTNLYNQNHIRGEDYAAGYAELYKATLQIVMDTWIKKLGVDLQAKMTEIQYESEDAKKALYAAQKDLVIQQTATESELRTPKKELLQAQKAKENAGQLLWERQTRGFDDNIKREILKICADTWGVAFSVANDVSDIAAIPGISKRPNIDALLQSVGSNMSVTFPAIDTSVSTS